MNQDYLCRYKFGKYPNNVILMDRILEAASDLVRQLDLLDIRSLGISEYNQRYLGSYIATENNRVNNLTRYAFILAWVLDGSDKEPENFTFVDYGGGHGLMSLLAKAAGIKQVIYCDIFEQSCIDAQLIGKQLGLEADVYLVGGIEALESHLGANGKSVDGIGSYDVIEHIYDVRLFLTRLEYIVSEGGAVFLASAANEKNPRIRKNLRRVHREFEAQDRLETKGRKPTDEIRSLFDVRLEIVRAVLEGKHFKNDELNKLAARTRGMLTEDIKRAAIIFMNSGIYPEALQHPTNTCDPSNGNWFENLLNPMSLSDILNQSGFQSEIRVGFYDSGNTKSSEFLKMIFNFSIRLLGKLGITLAPYYAIYAKRMSIGK
ncbi:methyltransferase domain-containing protein [Gammaproteobacteria bacterium]|nr:methyltransferase domain-containing protein [Gammaproteobacteria bacterium]